MVSFLHVGARQRLVDVGHVLSSAAAGVHKGLNVDLPEKSAVYAGPEDLTKCVVILCVAAMA